MLMLAWRLASFLYAKLPHKFTFEAMEEVFPQLTHSEIRSLLTKRDTTLYFPKGQAAGSNQSVTTCLYDEQFFHPKQRSYFMLLPALLQEITLLEVSYANRLRSIYLLIEKLFEISLLCTAVLFTSVCLFTVIPEAYYNEASIWLVILLPLFYLFFELSGALFHSLTRILLVGLFFGVVLFLLEAVFPMGLFALALSCILIFRLLI